MVKTRDQKAVDRARIEKLNLEQLREEAQRYNLPSTGERSSLIEGIMTFMEKNQTCSEGPLAIREEDPTRTLQQVLTSVESIVQQQREAQQRQEQFLQQQQQQFLQQQQQFLQQQQQQFAQLVRLMERREATPTESQDEAARITERTDPSAAERTNSSLTGTSDPAVVHRVRDGIPSGNAVTQLASQIPEFGGAEEDNVQVWVRRVDRVARVHGATDGVTLLAASSKLTNSAKRWYEIQTGPALESWNRLKVEMGKIFDRKIPFYKAMQKIEARKWSTQKESFDQYAIDKLALMHRLDLTDEDSIQLLAGGILQSSIRATALSITADTLDVFLEKMRHITQGIMEPEKKTATPNGPQRTRENVCKNCGKRGHHHKDCRGDPTCFYCKEKGHRRFDCPTLKRKESRTSSSTQGSSRATAASVATTDSATFGSVATVTEALTKLEVDSPFVKVNSINNKKCSLLALVDTGSPVSFIKESVVIKYFKYLYDNIKPVENKLRNLNNEPLSILGIIQGEIALFELGQKQYKVNLHVLEHNTFEGDLILGRDFLTKERLTLVYTPKFQGDKERVDLFAYLPLCVEHDNIGSYLEQRHVSVSNLNEEVKEKLEVLLTEINNKEVEAIEDDYTVQVNLKDTSVYAYAPRRFAHAERLQIREITDTLLERGIIQPSISPYCARVVPVKKKNGQIRLCVDLRPLNSRVEKQKYPFPLIEDCLTKLSNRKIFTLLDMKDGFHQIKVHKDSTKYFSFATPDGQYEYKRLPFGYCEHRPSSKKELFKY